MKINKRLEDMLSAAERYILMLFYAAGGKVRGKLWFQKEMFELSKAFNDLGEELDFDAYNYGPFSEGLEESRDMMENSGLIKELMLTDKGREIARTVWELADDRKKGIVKETAMFLENLDDDELLLYTYVTSPKMAARSDVVDRILNKRVEIALKMLEKGKVSVSLAAKLAGLPVTKMVEEAVKRGIKPFDVQGDIEAAN